MNLEFISQYFTFLYQDITTKTEFNHEFISAELNPADYNFAYFLNQALKNMQKGGGGGGGRKYGRDGGTTTIEFELPTLDQFVEMAKIVEKCLEEEWAEEGQQQMTIKLMPELATIQRF
jgi:hypothetical protein